MATDAKPLNSLNTEEFYKHLSYGSSVTDLKMAKVYLNEKSRCIFHLIDGLPLQGENKENLSTVIGDLTLEISNGDEAGSYFHDALESAGRAQKDFGLRDNCLQHSKQLYKFAEVLDKNQLLLSELLCLQSGLPLKYFSSTVVPHVCKIASYYAGLASLQNSEKLKFFTSIGTHLCIITSGSCFAELAYCLFASLASGNSVCLTATKDAPLLCCAYTIVDLFNKAGLPKGVVQFVIVNNITDLILKEEKEIAMVSCLGDEQLSQQIVQSCSSTSDITFTSSSEGRQAYIICDNSDIDSAVDDLIGTIWSNRSPFPSFTIALIQEPILEGFIHKVEFNMKRLVLGDCLNESIDVSERKDSNFEKIIEMAEKDGIEVYSPFNYKKGFVVPTFLKGVQMSSPVLTELTSGDPFLVVLPFRTIKECLTISQNIQKLCLASIWTESNAVALELTEKLSTSSVFVNCHERYDVSTANGRNQFGMGLPGEKALMHFSKLNEETKVTELTKHLQTYIATMKESEMALCNKNEAMNCIQKAKKASSNWLATPTSSRRSALLCLASNLDSTAQPSPILEQFVSTIRSLILNTFMDRGNILSIPFEGEVKELIKPCGVVAITITGDSLSFLNAALTAVCRGSCVILIGDKQTAAITSSLIKLLKTSTSFPEDILSVLYGDALQLTQLMTSSVDGIIYCGQEGQNIRNKCYEKRKDCSVGNVNEVFPLTLSDYKYVWTTSGEIFSN